MIDIKTKKPSDSLPHHKDRPEWSKTTHGYYKHNPKSKYHGSFMGDDNDWYAEVSKDKGILKIFIHDNVCDKPGTIEIPIGLIKDGQDD